VDEETIIQLIQEDGENRNEGDDELPVISAKEGLKALEAVNIFLL